MPDATPDTLTQIAAYYAQDREHDRLTRGLGLIEFMRTLEMLSRLLPPRPRRCWTWGQVRACTRGNCCAPGTPCTRWTPCPVTRSACGPIRRWRACRP
ncbi:hypothetical protein [Deinococcus aquaticus]|uniref:hypothetical protein n=1 Tax=Deinococcus aquaticus TaxID=328692 RepID=UPI003607A47F